MKTIHVLFAVALSLLLIVSCAGPGACECGGTCAGCADQAGAAATCPAAETCPAAGGAAEAACAGCVALQAGGTGWCADCQKGYNEGQEVNCQGACAGNAGGPPCPECVK